MWFYAGFFSVPFPSQRHAALAMVGLHEPLEFGGMNLQLCSFAQGEIFKSSAFHINLSVSLIPTAMSIRAY